MGKFKDPDRVLWETFEAEVIEESDNMERVHEDLALDQVSAAERREVAMPNSEGQRLEFATRIIITDTRGRVASLSFDGGDVGKFSSLIGGKFNRPEILVNLSAGAIHCAIREAMEEAGLEFVQASMDYLGRIIEHRPHQGEGGIRRIVFVFQAKVKNAFSIGEPQFTKKERRRNARLEWSEPHELMGKLDESAPTVYAKKYSVHRDAKLVRRFLM